MTGVCLAAATAAAGAQAGLDSGSDSGLGALRNAGADAGLAAGLDPDPQLDEYLDLSLRDLLAVEITSASKTEQQLRDVASAVYVIDSEQIRRSGATTIPDVLRTVPGVDVGQFNAHTWEVSVRGFNGSIANKLLVLIDGRSVYSPLFGGVFWDVQNLMLDDVDRIEVIRGPGGAIWGANAVNGVINIITRSAADTHGTHLSAGSGNQYPWQFSARHGGRLAEGVDYRIYASGFRTADTELPDGGDDDDRMQFAQAGFRADSIDGWTLQGSFYRGKDHQVSEIPSLTPPFGSTVHDIDDTSGGHLLGRWTRVFDGGGRVTVKGYYDRTERDSETFVDRQDTLDMEFVHQLAAIGRHALIWGGGYRFVHDDASDTPGLVVSPQSRSDSLFSLFVQDEFSLADPLRLVIGSKVEHNDYSGFEFQPNARLIWTPQANQTVWAAVSRAVHTPTRLEQDISLRFVEPGPPPVLLSLDGNDDFDSEELLAYEAGFRSQVTPDFSLDAAVFYNKYNNLRDFELTGALLCQPSGKRFPACDPTDSLLSQSIPWQNGVKADTWGGELSLVWRVADNLLLRTNYSYLKVDLDADAGAVPVDNEGSAPRHQLKLNASWDVTPEVDTDLGLRYVSELYQGEVPGYTELDVRVAWRPRNGVELSLSGRNLLHKDHIEALGGNQVGRAILGLLRLDF